MKNRNSSRMFKFQPAVIGVFPNKLVVEKVYNQLSERFSESDITIMLAKSSELFDLPIHKDLIVGATIGGFAGAVIGALLTILSSVGILPLPGQALMNEVGLFLSAVAGACIGFNAGSLSGVIVGYAAAKFEFRRIQKYVERRGVAVSVNVPGPKEQLIAKGILVKAGAVKIYNPRQLRSDGAYVLNKDKVVTSAPI